MRVVFKRKDYDTFSRNQFGFRLERSNENELASHSTSADKTNGCHFPFLLTARDNFLPLLRKRNIKLSQNNSSQE